jgi:organic radical activating enzyme
MIAHAIARAVPEMASIDHRPDGIGALVDEIRQELLGRRVVIYPAGQSGRMLRKTLAEHGIPVERFIDRAAVPGSEVDDLPVSPPSRLADCPEGTLVLVSANLDTLVDRLLEAVRGFNDRAETASGFHLNRLLKYPACRARLDSGAPFDLIECEHCGFERHGCALMSAYLRRVGGATPFTPEWRSAAFTWFGYIVGQACTLRCVHCCEAIPFLKGRRFVPREIILRDVRKVAEASRFLTFVELVGGEPFLHPDYKAILRGLLEIGNIGYIKSFTNGTIVPDRELCDILKHPRFMLQVSNYEQQAQGKLQENIRATRSVLREQGIRYIFTPNFEWQDFTSFELHHTDDAVLENVFQACTLRNCNRLHNGALYRCPHQYAGVELGVLRKHPVECVEIDRMGSVQLAEALETFESVRYIDACRHCRMPFDAPPVPAGIQMRRRQPQTGGATG